MALQEALQALLMDIRAKQTGKRKIAAAEHAARGVGEEPENEEEAAAHERKRVDRLPPLQPGLPFPLRGHSIRWAVLVQRYDPMLAPGNDADVPVLKKPWHGKEVFVFPGIIFAPTIADLILMATADKPVDSKGFPRCIHNFLGAITDPGFDDSGVPTVDPEAIVKKPRFIMMTPNEHVEAWLEMSKASPLHLLVILKQIPSAGALSPPGTLAPEGWTNVDLEDFDVTLEPMEASSEDKEPVTRKRPMPRTDAGWQSRLRKLRARRDRSIAYIKDLEKKYLERWPDGIVEGDPNFDTDLITTQEERRTLREGLS